MASIISERKAKWKDIAIERQGCRRLLMTVDSTALADMNMGIGSARVTSTVRGRPFVRDE